MGKKEKNKKKGAGKEKTAAKTERKLSNRRKKELQAKGEEDIETILSQIEKEEQKQLQVIEITVEPPSRRLNFTLIPHPEKDQLILYGGEYFNGQKTFIYNDLFFYNIANNTWTLVKAPNGPPPRCAHQMVATSANKGQLWLFGGEFSSPTQSQFYHYRDLWVYHIAKKQWEKIQAPNGPSARSGHRMVISKKQLIVFGGFHDNLRDYKYFNDVYAFNMETYKWSKLEPVGTPPAPRSGCCMIALNDGRILIYGGYSKEKVKKDVDKGHTYTDAFILSPDKNDTTGTKWKWLQTKIGGVRFSPRCSMPMTIAPNGLSAYCFGGVFDVEDDETIAGQFFNEIYQLDLEKLVWKPMNLQKKKENQQETVEKMEVDEVPEAVEPTTVADDGVFKVTIGRAPTNSRVQAIAGNTENVFQPLPRASAGLAIKHGNLYVYGGMSEEDDKQITFNDFYSIDLKKMEEWKILVEDNLNLEWIGSDSDSDKGEDEDSEDDDNDEDEDEEDDEEED